MMLLPRSPRYALWPLLLSLHCGSPPDDPTAVPDGETPMDRDGSSAEPSGGGGPNADGETSGSPGPGSAEELPSDLDPSNGMNTGNEEPPGGSAAPDVDCTSATLDAGNHELTLEHDGLTREYLVHVPDSYDPSAPVPLVVDMHGLTSSAAAQARFGW